MMATVVDSAPSTVRAPVLEPADPEPFTLATVNPRIPLLVLGLVLLTVLTTWIFGHLPWVLDGFRSPYGTGEQRLVIPLIAGQLTALVAFSAVGSVTATLLPLAFPEIPRGVAVVAAALTVAATTLVLALTARSSIATHATDSFAGDDRVLDGLVVGVFLVTACAGFLGCLASFQVGLLPLPVAVLVGQLPLWIGRLGVSAGLADTGYRCAGVALLTAAFVFSVRRSRLWIAGWPVALLILWAAHPLWFATWRMQDRLHPGAGLRSDNLSDVFAEGREAFSTMFWRSQENWWVGVLAATLAGVWLLVHRRLVTPER